MDPTEQWPRVVLPTKDGSLVLPAVRDAIVCTAEALCGFNVGVVKGDPIFDYVTEGRQTSWLVNGKRRHYSSCGDLPWAVLWLLAGDHRYENEVDRVLACVNRREAYGYRTAKNIEYLHSRTGKAWTWYKPDRWSPSKLRGTALLVDDPEHVCIVEDAKDDGTITTFDYGQFFQREGRSSAEHGGCRRRKKWHRIGNRIFVHGGTKPGRPVMGWLDLATVLANAHAVTGDLIPSVVPATFRGGRATDNPYLPPRAR